MSDAMVSHWDACLGCMACVTACPSGVQYDTLIEQTRAQVERRHERPAEGQGAARADLRAVPLPAGGCELLRGPLRAMQRPGLDRAMRRTRAAGPDGPAAGRDGASRAASGQGRSRCRRTSRPRASGGPSSACSPAACRARSSRASTPRPRGCCRPRAATWSSRRRRAAAARCRCTTAASRRRQDFARRLIDTFEAAGVERVVVNAAGCGSTMKEYATLLADDPAYAERARGLRGKVRDVAEILDELGPVAPRHPLELTGRLPRRLPPRRTPRASGPSRAGCSRRSPASS